MLLYNTVKVTFRRGVRTCLRPNMSRMYPTNDRMLRYNRLPHPVFSDTMQAGVISKDGHRYAQAFCTQFGWARMHPMKRKGDAHEALSLMFHRDGVPPRIVVDNSKEQTMGKFAKKCREADCHLTTTLPYAPWMQAAEGCIGVCKRSSSRRMLKYSSPKTLWDHCLPHDAIVRFHAALDIYGLEGQVPETVMSGQAADISAICEFEWFQ